MSNWKLLIVLGVVSVIAGILALLNPFSASFAIEQFTAWVFLVLGGVQIIAAFRAQSWSGKLWTLLLGIIIVSIGINLLAEPLAGIVTLAILVGAMFIVSGIFKIIIGLRFQRAEFKTTVLVSGALSLVIGVMLMYNPTILGTLLGVELIANGVSTIAIGFAHKTDG